MSTEPLPGPDPYDYPPRFRWVTPLLIGLGLGLLFGGAAIFVIMSLANRPRTTELAVERFNPQNIITNTAGAESIAVGNNSTDYLGQWGRRTNSGSSAHRRITLNGSVRPTVDANSLGNALKTQIDAELARHGAMITGGGSSSSSGGTEFTMTWDSGFYTRDGRRSHIDGEITIRKGMADVLIILHEGR